MRPAGYTLIELLVVISIIAIMSLVGFVNFKGFSQDQVTIKAAGQVQSLLRLAQSNATSSTVCNNAGALSWQLVFSSVGSNIILECSNSTTTNFSYRTYTLEGAEVSSITGSGCSSSSTQVAYTAGVGNVTFIDLANSNSCINTSNSLIITVRNRKSTTSLKNITISKGGTIDVQ